MDVYEGIHQICKGPEVDEIRPGAGGGAGQGSGETTRQFRHCRQQSWHSTTG